jgi:putative ABC transport system permease protein
MEASGASLAVFSGDVADLVFSSVSQKEVDGIRAVDGVTGVARVNFSMVRPPRGEGGKRATSTILCFGRYPEERIMNRYDAALVAGRLLEKKDEIIVSRWIAGRFGWKVGTTVPLFDRDFKVVGIYESDIPWENGGLIMHAGVLAERLGRKDNYTLVFVYSAPQDAGRVAAALRAEFPRLTVVEPREFTNAFRDQLEIVDQFIALITIIAIVVGVLGVLNTMMMSVSERTREIGVLRALGWRRRKILALILNEALAMGLVSVVVAVGVAFGLAWLLGRLPFYGEAFRPVWGAEVFVRAAGIALVLGLIGGLFPALRASRMQPIEALRYE